MFESGGSMQAGAEAPGVLSGVPEVEWTAVLRERHAGIARAQFLEVDAVASVYLARCAEDARRGCNEAFQGEFAHVEVGVMLTVTEPVARRWIGLGLDLRWRLHATSVAFSTGRIDQSRAQAISDALANVSPDKVELVERLLLDGIEGATTSTIRRTARRLVARHDPAGAKARREQGEADRDVRFRANDDGTCSMEGTLPGPAGQVVAMRLRTMCFEVCGSDPRTFAQRRADALVALADGSGRLLCLCGRTDCTQTVRSSESRPCDSGTAPHPSVSDVAAPDADESAPQCVGLDGHGDAGDHHVGSAREDGAGAASAVDGVGAMPPEVDARGADDGVDSSGLRNARSNRSGSRDDPILPSLPPATVHVGVNLTTLLGLDDLPAYLAGHGWIDADLARDIAADGTWRKVLTLTDADREALLDALCGHAGQGGGAGEVAADDASGDVWLSGRRIETLAHGKILGIGRALTAAGITPSAIRERSRRRREQLTYRPCQRLAEIVRARDGICRFPGCSVRAVSCDIDHTVPFDHAKPASGGWTVEQNLACLCRRHHRLKTLGRWNVRQLGGGRLEWTTPSGELVITEPLGEFSADATAPPCDTGTASRDEQSSDAAGCAVRPLDGAGSSVQPPDMDGSAATSLKSAGPAVPPGDDGRSNAESAAPRGVTLTDPHELARLFGQPRGRG
ncbi:DUF222 domain-containing protein [Rhodococcus sp. NPDC003322]